MTTKLFKGVPVIDAKTGARLGRIHAVYFDPRRREIAGFSLRRGGFFWRTRPGLVDVTRVRRIDADGVIVNGRASFGGAARDPRQAGLIALDDLTRRPVRLEDGTVLGRIAAVRFSPWSRRLTGIEVDPPGQPLCRMLLDADQIVRIGASAVVVHDRADAPTAPSWTPSAPVELGDQETRRVA